MPREEGAEDDTAPVTLLPARHPEPDATPQLGMSGRHTTTKTAHQLVSPYRGLGTYGGRWVRASQEMRRTVSRGCAWA
ncbi:hypothetical protein BP6252_02036 [Coleophoma cylindrospora]|uniref:Uncharacterized protein n=1 Tax=Coleophoma cylindrospora TaxID=1849047 RepID=A0A3D8SDM4_9HELO|nr:hypothetical protein BP6252_02036 [Coleophoma cylindrospora]